MILSRNCDFSRLDEFICAATNRLTDRDHTLRYLCQRHYEHARTLGLTIGTT